MPLSTPVLLSARVVLVGCGNMGEAMLAGWLANGLAPARVLVIEPHASRGKAVHERHGVAVATDPVEDLTADAVVLAVKPQTLEAVAPAYARVAANGAVILSIAAGRTLASLSRALGESAAVVRAMPNTPAAVGRGMAGACANAFVAPRQRDLVDALLAAVGDVVWLNDETLIDAVTAVSGSGPAYVFYLVECLTEAAVAVGLPAAVAQQLARTTITGAGELLYRSTEPAAELRARVTSPGGTTATALTALMAPDGLQPLVTEAVRRAALRARELAD